jgi:hypothetical protein
MDSSNREGIARIQKGRLSNPPAVTGNQRTDWLNHIADATLPPFAMQAAFDFVGSHPSPLQEFCPLHALCAVLHALVPLQELIPVHMTVFAAFAAAGVAGRPPMASAIAAAARVVVFILIS